MKETIREALDTGHKASTALREALEEMAKHECVSDRLGVFACGTCIICTAKELLGEH